MGSCYMLCTQEQSELKQQLEALQREKELMQSVAVADNDIVNLNIGGTLMSSKRLTLTQVCTFCGGRGNPDMWQLSSTLVLHLVTDTEQ